MTGTGMRVNLLPGEIARKNQVARQRTGLVLAGAGVLLLLALVYVFQLSRVGDARAELAAEQAVVTQLQLEVDQLTEFAELETQLQDANTLIGTALSDEATVAGVLQDIAVVMPSDAQLDTLTLTLGEFEQTLGAERLAVGSLVATGKSLERHAPGLERLLIDLDKVAAFSNVYFSSATLDEENVLIFNVELDLGPEVLTGRYVNGVPEALR